MKDTYKLALESIVNELDKKDETPYAKGQALLELIHALIKVYLVIIGQNAILLWVQLRNIEDSIMKARYN